MAFRGVKKILFALLIAFVAIQFIQPVRNSNGRLLATDITKTMQVPDSVLGILKIACYDCHSNNTRYPWYINIQPVAWIMASHIKEGKANLNLSEFGAYSKRKGANKLRSISESMKDGSMPLSSYTMMHKDAKLTETQKKIIMDWASKTRDSLMAK